MKEHLLVLLNFCRTLVYETGNPAKKFPIEGIDKPGRYKLGTIRIRN
jgi:hypothetical protein